MAIINIGIINRKILFAVFGGLFKLGANIILYRSEVKMNNHPCIIGINAGIGLSLAFFPFIYLKIRNNKWNRFNSSQNISDKDLIYNNTFSITAQKQTKKKFFYILAIATFDFLQKFLTFFYVNQFLENFWIFDSFLILLFSFLILKTKAYKHHFISLIMIIIIGIILISINYYDQNVTYLHVLITLFTEIFYCIENVICKLALDIKFSNPYEICFYAGFFELIMFTFLLIIFTNVPASGSNNMNTESKDYIDNFFNYIDKVDFNEVLIFILSMLSRCIFILFGFITVDYFSPMHTVLILIIGEVSFLFISDYNWKLYVKIFFFIFLIFFVLIFTEIIEINLFGLQLNTKKNIIKRSEEDPSQNDNFSYSSESMSDKNPNSRLPSIVDIQLPLININENENQNTSQTSV